MESQQLPAVAQEFTAAELGKMAGAFDRALEKASSVEDLTQLRTKVEAFRIYCLRSRNIEAGLIAGEVRLRTERKIGLVLIRLAAENLRCASRQGNPGLSKTRLLRLKDLGIKEWESNLWQRIARLPEPKFEVTLQQLRRRGGRLTSITFLREAGADYSCNSSAAQKYRSAKHYLRAQLFKLPHRAAVRLLSDLHKELDARQAKQ